MLYFSLKMSLIYSHLCSPFVCVKSYRWTRTEKQSSSIASSCKKKNRTKGRSRGDPLLLLGKQKWRSGQVDCRLVRLPEKLHGQSMTKKRSALRFWFRSFRRKKVGELDIALRLRFCCADLSPARWSSGSRAPIIAEELRSEVRKKWISHPAWISIWYQVSDQINIIIRSN